MADFLEVSCAVIMKGPKSITHVLATQRSAGMPHPGTWEFPGGKLHEGESAEGSIVREIREELGVVLKVRGRLDPVEHHYDHQSIRLIPLLCVFADGVEEGQIRLTEHQAWQWVPLEELDQVDWLEADLLILEQIRALG